VDCLLFAQSIAPNLLHRFFFINSRYIKVTQQSRIYVGNLSYGVTQDQLVDFFTQYGEITDAKLITDRDTGRSKGFGFITFAEQSAVEAALVADGTELDGRKLKVNIAKEMERRTGGGGGGGGDRGRSRY